MIKKLLIVIILALPVASKAQVIDGQKILFYTGFSMGTSYYNGDLNPNYFPQVNFALTEPYFSVFLAHYFDRFVTARLNFYYAWVKGDDSYSDPDFPQPSWYRYERNLRFRSSIQELSLTAEINIIPATDALGIVQRKYVPYILVGIGAFHFNPVAPYQPNLPASEDKLTPGNYVSLQPLGTEGEGTTQYPNRSDYGRIAGCFPLGTGVKYNVDKQVTVQLECGIRLTTTDYLDDVSTTYVNPQYLINEFGTGSLKAQEAVYFANRSLDTELSQPGDQRGDPSHLDHYVFTGVTLIYRIPGITAIVPQ